MSSFRVKCVWETSVYVNLFVFESMNFNTVILINTGRQSCWPHMTFYWLYSQVSTDNHFCRKGLQVSKNEWNDKGLKSKLHIRTICHWNSQLRTNNQSEFLSSSWNLMCSFMNCWSLSAQILWLQQNVDSVLCYKLCTNVCHRSFRFEFTDCESKLL